MNYIGDFTLDATVYIYFTTHDKDGGAVAPLTAFENSDVRIYKNGSGDQKTAVDGLTMTSPFDSIVGLHCLAIDTSNDTNDAGWWVAGSEYMVVLSPDTETIDTETALSVLATFSIERNLGAQARLKAVPAVDLTKINGAAQTATLDTIKAETVLIVADTGELQTNQGNWLTATGFATPTNITAGTITTVTTLTNPVTLANGAHGGAGATITLQTPIAATVPDTQKVDVETIKTRAVTCAAGVTVLASVGTAAASTAQTGDSYAIVNGDHGLVSIQDDIDEILTDTGTTIPGTITTMQGNVTTIMADTDLLDDAIGGLANIHTDVAAVKAETAELKAAVITNATGVDIAADIIAIKTETASILVWAGSGGAIEWTYTLTNSVGGAAIADADIWVTSDIGGTSVIASGKTNQSGVVTFYLDAGTVYVWRQKSGFDFTNPDQETVS